LSKRRQFLACAAALAAAPSIALAQANERVWRVGVLTPRSRIGPSNNDPLRGFLQGMRDRGYVEGKNLQYEWRFAEGDYARLFEFADQLVKLNVDVILAAGNPAAQAAKRATRRIPIVFNMSAPVEAGLVASLAHPGGNITGMSTIGTDLLAKQLELLAAALPGLSRIAVLVNPSNTTHSLQLQAIITAAKRRKVTVEMLRAGTPDEIRSAFVQMRERHAQGVVITNDSFLIQQTRALAREALAIKVPAIFSPQDFAASGGLMAYGVDLASNYRRAASHVDRILKGAKPADLPVEEPSEFMLVINLDTARALGVTVPQSLLLSATRLVGR
jgi:putative tryptophan/tyrosine transport system substrate-binding protein